MTFLCDNPWIFHRDELDLLEEDLDEIFHQHESQSCSDVAKMEEQVLQEQVLTEESMATAEILFEREEPLHEPSVQATIDSIPLVQALRAQTIRDPLYEQIYVWAQRVFAYTTDQYFNKDHKEEDLFRIHINVYMIPIKFASAAEWHIEKDRQLCFLYFSRTLDSLQHRSFFGDKTAEQLMKEGRACERLSQLHLSV